MALLPVRRVLVSAGRLLVLRGGPRPGHRPGPGHGGQAHAAGGGDPPQRPGPPPLPGGAVRRGRRGQSLRAVAERIPPELGRGGPGRGARQRHGRDPAEARRAEADLVVMATHGRGGLRRLCSGAWRRAWSRPRPCPCWSSGRRGWALSQRRTGSPAPGPESQRPARREAGASTPMASAIRGSGGPDGSRRRGGAPGRAAGAGRSRPGALLQERPARPPGRPVRRGGAPSGGQTAVGRTAGARQRRPARAKRVADFARCLLHRLGHGVRVGDAGGGGGVVRTVRRPGRRGPAPPVRTGTPGGAPAGGRTPAGAAVIPFHGQQVRLHVARRHGQGVQLQRPVDLAPGLGEPTHDEERLGVPLVPGRVARLGSSARR
jgi:hypothetical protein